MAKIDDTMEQLKKMVADSIAAAMAAQKAAKPPAAKRGRKPLTDEEKAKNRAKTDEETVKNFQKAGYKDVQPRVNVLTYNKWLEQGRRVKKGEKSIKCGSFPLFHLDQTEPVATEGTVH